MSNDNAEYAQALASEQGITIPEGFEVIGYREPGRDDSYVTPKDNHNEIKALEARIDELERTIWLKDREILRLDRLAYNSAEYDNRTDKE